MLQGRLGETISQSGFTINIYPNQAYLSSHPDAFKPDHYGFTVHSKRSLLGMFTGKDLVVALPDETVAIVKIMFTHEVPQLAADVVNSLAETYIEDFIDNKSGSASKALKFIDEQIALAEKKLKESEATLAKYKTQSRVVDVAMETDAKLKRIGELEIRKLNLKLQQTGLADLLEYIQSDSLSLNLHPNYESIQDAAFTDAILKFNTLKSTRKDLLQKYTLAHPEVIKTEEEIARTRSFLSKSVKNTLTTNRGKIESIEISLAQINGQFAKLPEVEKQMMLLKRQFLTQEQVYAFLLERRAEAAIGAASTISFHKILEKGPVPQVPITPQKSLIMGLSGIIGLIIAVLLIFLYNYMTATVFYPSDIEETLELPLISQVNKISKEPQVISQDFINLATNIHLVKPASLISICSYTAKEGKTRVSIHLAKAFAAIGYKTVLIDADLYNPRVHEYFDRPNFVGLNQLIIEDKSIDACVQDTFLSKLHIVSAGEPRTTIPTTIFLHPQFQVVLEQLKANFDRIVVNTPNLKEVRDAIPIMQQSGINLWVARADQTRFQHMKDAIALMRRFSVPDLYAILLQGESSKKKLSYQLHDGPLPRVGHGARRKMLKDLLRFLLFKKDSSGNTYDFLPRIGRGIRRKAIIDTVRKLFNL